MAKTFSGLSMSRSFRDGPPGAATSRALYLIALALLVGACSRPDQRALESFVQTYVSSHNSGDVQTLVDLVELPENRPDLRRFVQMAFAEEVLWPLKDIQIEPLSRKERDRIKDRFPLEPRWRVYVILDTEDRFTSIWLAGKTGDEVALLVEKSAHLDPPDPR